MIESNLPTHSLKKGWHRVGAALLIAFSMQACSNLERHESFATPEDTLRTFQSAFQRGDSALEYKCLSAEFRDEIGRFQNYDAYRQLAIDENASVAFVLSHNDLSDNIEGIVSESGRAELEAEIVLSVYGRRVVFEFVNEREIRVELYDGKPLRDYLKREPEIRMFEGHLMVPIDDLEIDENQLRLVRGWTIVPNWKFKSLAPRPL